VLGGERWFGSRRERGKGRLSIYLSARRATEGLRAGGAADERPKGACAGREALRERPGWPTGAAVQLGTSSWDRSSRRWRLPHRRPWPDGLRPPWRLAPNPDAAKRRDRETYRCCGALCHRALAITLPSPERGVLHRPPQRAVSAAGDHRPRASVFIPPRAGWQLRLAMLGIICELGLCSPAKLGWTVLYGEGRPGC